MMFLIRPFPLMPGSSALSLLFALAAVGEAIAAEGLSTSPLRPRAITRREGPRRPTEVLLESGGATLKTGSESKASQSKGYDNTDVSQKTCNFGYVLGQRGGIDCPDIEKHELVLDPEVCKLAAADKGVAANQAGFTKNTSDWASHPPGCFQSQCGADDHTLGLWSTDDCFFFNPNTGSDFPSCRSDFSCQGEVVCKRTKFKDGTVNATGQVVCPAGYSSIEEPDECTAAGDCLEVGSAAYRPAAKILSEDPASFPQGCFVLAEDSPGFPCCIYYNAPNSQIVPDPVKIPQHTPRPLCVITGTTSYH